MKETVYGNTRGIKKSDLKSLQDIYRLAVNKNIIISLEMARLIASISGAIQREIAVFIDRRGKVVSVGVGGASTVPLNAKGKRRGDFRLCGLRCIHTHPSGDARLSAVDYAALSEMRLDAMVSLGLTGTEINNAYIACPDPKGGGEIHSPITFGPLSSEEIVKFQFIPLIREIELKLKRPSSFTAGERKQPEKAILVTMDGRDSLDELARLVKTAGASPVAQVMQNKHAPDSAYFIGRGKVDEIAALRQLNSAELAIFDDELTPTQTRNLQNLIGCRVIDRTSLILDIFSQRARTKEGKLQVELAQLHYLLPRLTGMGTALSRLGGGIGTRGPGETKLETDRRHIRRRIEEITRNLEQIRRHRQKQRQKRRETSIPVAALVGYTNAGKSTLLNALTKAQVLTADQMFATLDPTTRRLRLPNRREILLTDTVGFIRKLPHHLVAAFRATLEEVVEADLLLHVVDASHDLFEEQIAAVNRVLKDLKADEKETIYILNKTDQPVDRRLLEHFLISCRNPVVKVSALQGTGLEELKQLIAKSAFTHRKSIKGRFPYDRADIVALIHRQGVVYAKRFEESGIWLEAAVDDSTRGKILPYMKQYT